jgi:hypothetical protein
MKRNTRDCGALGALYGKNVHSLKLFSVKKEMALTGGENSSCVVTEDYTGYLYTRECHSNTECWQTRD